MLRTTLVVLTFCLPVLSFASAEIDGDEPVKYTLISGDTPEAKAYLAKLTAEEKEALGTMHPAIQNTFVTPGSSFVRKQPDRSLIIPLSRLAYPGYPTVMCRVFDWYHPSAEEIAQIASLGFSSNQMPAALRLRGLITPEKAPYLKRLVSESSVHAPQELALSAGLPHAVLTQAADLPPEVQHSFLRDYPRPASWYLSMLGVDPYVDYAILRPWFITQLVCDPDIITTFEELIKDEATSRRVSTFFWATHTYSPDCLPFVPHLERVAATHPFFPFVNTFLREAGLSYTFPQTSFYQKLTQGATPPLHGFSHQSGNLKNVTPFEAPLPFRELMAEQPARESA